MNAPLLFLDVNIPMYAAGTDHPYKAACVWIMQEVAEGRLAVAIDTEVVQEILHRFGAIRRVEIGVTMAENLLDLVATVHPVVVADIRQAIQLYTTYAEHGVTARDALHAAVMRNNGLTHILSTDQHFDRIEGITRLGVGSLTQTRSDVERLS